MRLNRALFFVSLLVFLFARVSAQTHITVPLEDQIYYILEQAELRGLCSPLRGIRPYTQSVVVSAINEILYSENSSKLRNDEREILEEYLERYSKPNTGIDLRRGAYFGETRIGSGTPVSVNLGARADVEGSGGLYFYTSSDDVYYGTEVWLQAYVNGDVGYNFSYNITAEGGLIRAPRNQLGTYNTYYAGFDDNRSEEYQNQSIDIYSEPLTHFPYTYKKRWDGSVFFLDDLSGFDSWPVSFAGGYGLLGEATASFLENRLMVRMGRISHEWGSAPLGSSLVFNRIARPFFGVEAEFYPVSWFSIASLTGMLEYNNTESIKKSSRTFQNAFSVTTLQFKYKNYLFFDIVDAVVYPKRFELGYIAPIIINFFYQNNVGDFDNMAISLTLRAQYPGLGNLWVSFFMDEMSFLSDIFTLDRQMFAIQLGTTFHLPFMSFSSVKISYTAVNPYCYTHNRNFNPWYGDLLMETSYTNNGVSLGYYLPPNSDELLIKFNTMPNKNINAHLQYQMIRHGADFGPSAPDGSNLLSELDPYDRSDNLILRKFFLQDGAYQWMHIIKLGVEWKPERVPIALFCEAGAVFSYFTNINEPANINGKPYNFSIVDTSVYPISTSFIARIGIRLFPK
ncbi:MAG: hypothetical protein LBQ89_03080 [Treponema sp.]|nr:hypothetical protein [Treponema sp.]